MRWEWTSCKWVDLWFYKWDIKQVSFWGEAWDRAGVGRPRKVAYRDYSPLTKYSQGVSDNEGPRDKPWGWIGIKDAVWGLLYSFFLKPTWLINIIWEFHRVLSINKRWPILWVWGEASLLLYTWSSAPNTHKQPRLVHIVGIQLWLGTMWCNNGVPGG